MFILPEWVPAAVTLVVMGAAVVSFVRERLPADMTALFALLALLLTGVLTPAEAFSGFSHPATVSVAAVLILSAALRQTGVLTVLARTVLAPLGRSETLLTVVLMVVIGTISAFINNTAAVAVFIPVVLETCRRSGAQAGRVLMPMAHAATLGGMCTLIGTSTNLAAHEYARSQGLAGFGMFELGRVGFPMALAGFAYILVVGRWFLPRTTTAPTGEAQRSAPYLASLVVPPGSNWIGNAVNPGWFASRHDLELVDLVRNRVSVLASSAPLRYEAGDRVRLRGPLDELLALAAHEHLEIYRPARMAPAAELVPVGRPAGAGAPPPEPSGAAASAPLVEVVVLAASGIVGQTLASSRFAERFGTVVLALHRPGSPLAGQPEHEPIHSGDVLVLEGTEPAISRIAASPGFVVAGSRLPSDLRPHKLGIVLLTIAAVVTFAALGWMPIVTAAAVGCAVLIASRCLEPGEAYRAIDLSIVFLLAGALALGTAIEKTGLAGGLGSLLAHLSGVTGPGVLLVGFFLVAVVLSELMSNSGTVLLLAPIAVASAEKIGANPMALIAAVAFGASAAFAMPIGYQTSLMVYGPGGYRFRDFVRMGLPLDLILAAIALTLIPRYWPLVTP